MSNHATASDLLAHTKRRIVENDVCGMHVRIRSITASEYSAVERLLIASASKASSETKRSQSLTDANTMLVRLCVCDGNGEPLFTESDDERLEELDARLMQSLVSVCMEHCGLGGNETEQAAKNSD